MNSSKSMLLNHAEKRSGNSPKPPHRRPSFGKQSDDQTMLLIRPPR